MMPVVPPNGASSRPIQACTSSASPIKYHASENLWCPSSKTNGPPPHLSGWKRHSWVAAWIGQAFGLLAALLLMRMVSGSPISPASISSFARSTGG